MIKSAIISFIAVSLFFASINPALAQVGSSLQQQPQNPSTPTSSGGIAAPSLQSQGNQQAGTTSTTQGAVRSTLQTRAVNEIQRRVTALTGLINLLGSSRLKDETKSELETQIQTKIEELTKLQSQIQSGGDEKVEGEFQETVVSTYPDYAIFLPKIRITLVGEEILTLAQTILDVQARVATQVANLSTSGMDTADADQTLIDVEESVTSAQNDATSAIDLVTSLSPDEYPNNKTTLQDARSLLRESRLSLVSARDSLKELTTMIASSSPQTMENTASTPAELNSMENGKAY